MRGRRIDVPARGVRPSQDRVRSAVFSSLAEFIPGARVLDLFAGSGAYGLEAYSRGAAGVCWVEVDGRIAAVLRRNVESLCGVSGRPAADPQPETVLVRDDVERFLRRGAELGGFDVVFADPPYEQAGDWVKKLLSLLQAGSMLKPAGLFVMEVSNRTLLTPMLGWELWKERVYGETRMGVFRKLAPEV